MFLSAAQIKQAVEHGELGITDFTETNVKPASYTFTLDAELRDPASGERIIIEESGYLLAPGAFMLAKTKESLTLNNRYLCMLGTRSSLARQGVDVLQSSSIAEPDTNSQLTLELTNHSQQAVTLVPGMRIAKGIFSPIKN